jgi:hypothetical protein
MKRQQAHLLVDLREDVGMQLLQRALQLRPVCASLTATEERPRLRTQGWCCVGKQGVATCWRGRYF